MDAQRRYRLICSSCGAEVPSDADQPRCTCDDPKSLIVEVDLSWAASTLNPSSLASRPGTLMRYSELLPFLGRAPAMSPLMTPLVKAPRLAQRLGLGNLRIKDEGCQPSGSLKARSSAVGVVRAAEAGYDTIACASSGNAAISMAAMAASEGLNAVAFVSKRVPPTKLAQLQAYGPRVVVVDGPYESAYALCEGACREFGWFNRNCAQDPFLVEGKKTCGLEIAEQTAARPSEWVAVPVGDGCTITGIWKGLCEAQRIGLVARTPRMLAVQARGAAAVRDAWAERRPLAEVEHRYADAYTSADPIAVTHPHNGDRALAAIADSGGAAVAVDDDEMRSCVLDLARCGVLLEPASAAGLAGVRAALGSGVIPQGSEVVLVGTGTGLKSLDEIAGIQRQQPAPIEPTLEALRRALAPA